METTPQPLPAGDPIACRPARYLMLGLGLMFVGLGVIGAFLPVMPTTVFLLLALWCFSRSSTRLQRWLYDHPKFGRTLRAWHRHRAIPTSAKVMAIATMATSLGVTTLLLADNLVIPMVTALVLVPVAAFILSRPSRPPEAV